MPVYKKADGFTLVEVLVAISLFALVMITVLDVLLQFGAVHKRSLSSHEAYDNIGFTMETMSRNILLGYNYHCGSTGTIGSPQDCGAGLSSNFIAFEGQDGDVSNSTDQVIYCLDTVSHQVLRSTIGSSAGACSIANANYVPISSQNLQVDDLKFFVSGTSPSDNFQPKATIVVSGVTKLPKTQLNTSFFFETTVSQRILDL